MAWECYLVKLDKLVLATSNKGKIAEFTTLLAPLNITVIPQTEFNVPDADETGLSFIENALLKARHAAQLTGLPALADDSGLAVDALNGAPGIYSARYAGENAGAEKNIAKLLDALKNVPDDKRTAAFHCVLALVLTADDPIPVVCDGYWRGRILTSPRGNHGFGYDPVFYVEDEQQTAAELGAEIKNRISHRSKALHLLIKHLREKYEAA